MKHIFLTENSEELARYKRFSSKTESKLNDYIAYLKAQFCVVDLPRTIVWTSKDIATKYISDIPIPAYTNEFRIIISPNVEDWRGVYLRQIEEYQSDRTPDDRLEKIIRYYDHCLSDDHIMQILGHELAHHSELFLDDFSSSESNGIWFEEGMAEYISRKYFLSEDEFEQELQINSALVDLYQIHHGNNSLEEFGRATYKTDHATIFYEYWRSFLAINQIVESFGGDIDAVFQSYHEWNQSSSKLTLSEWFNIST